MDNCKTCLLFSLEARITVMHERLVTVMSSKLLTNALHNMYSF
jgi:hypothetical protein